MNDKDKQKLLQREMRQYRLRLRDLERKRLDLMKQYLKRVEEIKMRQVRGTM